MIVYDSEFTKCLALYTTFHCTKKLLLLVKIVLMKTRHKIMYTYTFDICNEIICGVMH